MSSGLEVGTLVGYTPGAGLVTALVYLLGEETMLAWGWRIPFFVAAPIGLIGFYLRNKLDEAPVYEAMESDKPEEENLMNCIFQKDLRFIGARFSLGYLWCLPIMSSIIRFYPTCRRI